MSVCPDIVNTNVYVDYVNPATSVNKATLVYWCSILRNFLEYLSAILKWADGTDVFGDIEINCYEASAENLCLRVTLDGRMI